MTAFSNELILNQITYGEFVPPFKKNFEEYKSYAHLFLRNKDKFIFEEDLLKRFSEGMTSEELAQNTKQYVPGINRQKDGIFKNTWYDLWDNVEIEREDTMYDYFFACKLRHQSLLDIDGFLTFHLDYTFKNQKQDFFRFLQLTLREYGDKLLNPNLIETVNEWIKANEADTHKETLAGDSKEDKIKGRVRREAGDNLTCLSQNQTALLIEFMRNARIILKDDLTYIQAGDAFNILTGYSIHTLRQRLGKKGAVEGVKHEDYKELLEAVKSMADMIEAKLYKK